MQYNPVFVFLYSNDVFLYVKVCKTVIAILLDNKYASYVIAIPLVNNLMPLGHRNIHIVTA